MNYIYNYTLKIKPVFPKAKLSTFKVCLFMLIIILIVMNTNRLTVHYCVQLQVTATGATIGGIYPPSQGEIIGLFAITIKW